VHSGPFWFGAVGQGLHTEVTIVGDLVNITSRLASLAKAGEILASVDAAAQAGLATDQSHPLAVKGRAEPIEVVSLSA
jgi:adenylate cyclase